MSKVCSYKHRRCELIRTFCSEVDLLIRNKLQDVECFVHKNRLPLGEHKNNLTLFDESYSAECSGYCFI